jgi:hypothetical protein
MQMDGQQHQMTQEEMIQHQEMMQQQQMQQLHQQQMMQMDPNQNQMHQQYYVSQLIRFPRFTSGISAGNKKVVVSAFRFFLL